MTYHTAGELLQGGAAALLSVCWLLFWEGGKQGECLGQVRGVARRARVMWSVGGKKGGGQALQK